MDNGNEAALWEVVLRIEGSDVAVATAFMAAGDKLDVVLGAQETAYARQYADIIRFAAHLIGTAKYNEDWTGIYPSGTDGNETRTLPF